MNVKNCFLIGIGATIALAALALLVLTPAASATNDPDIAGGSVFGDWTVTDSRTYDSVTIYIESGNLTVAPGASLTLNSVRIRFNSTYEPGYDGNYTLEVQAKGALTANSGTNISSNLTNVHYKFIAKGTLTMDNSSASEMWGDNSSWAGGIQVYSDQTSIISSLIYRGMTGGISIFNCSPTIYNNTIRANGQDGNSTQYAYGIYAYNTRTSFSFNTICDNMYAAYSYYSKTQSKSPSGSGYYWNGNWYYYYWYYQYYRYEYNYLYSRGSMYGTGIQIEGGSNAALTNNTILRNGWAAGGGYSYAYNVWEDASHQIMYQYTYNYVANKLYGKGVVCKDSAVEIFGNRLDRNGLDPSTWSSSDYICSYYSFGIQMLNSTGNITFNNIQGSSTLIYNLASSPNIVNNTLATDYGAYNLLVERTGYGIRNEKSSPKIINNTIKLSIIDYQIYMGGSYMNPMDTMIGIENLYSPNVLIKNCKITTEGRGYGVVSGIGINASLKSSRTSILDCTIEYAFSGYSYGVPGQPIGVQFALLSGGTIDNCTLKTTSGASGTGPVMTGAMVAYGSSVVLVNSSVTGCGVGVYITDYSTIEIKATKITGVTTTGVRSDFMSHASLKNVKVTGSARGFMAVQGRITIRDCDLNNPMEFVIDKSALIDVYNTPHTKGSVLIFDNASYLNVSWPVGMSVIWQNEVPVQGASVTLATIAGATVFTGTTDENGTFPNTLWVKEYMAHDLAVTRFTPHRVTAAKGRVSSMELFLIDQPVNITFRLVDAIPPDLLVKFPFDGQRLNYSMVTFDGVASDAESGLINSGTIELNVDNTGWVPISVNPLDNRWSFARPFTDGIHVVRVKAEDLAGNLARESLTISVDTTGPILTVFSPKEGSYTNQRTIIVSGITEENAFVTVNGINVPLDKRYFSAQISLEDGPNLITVVASDASGNARTVQVHLTLDTQPPLLDITSPRRGEYTNQDPVSVTGTSEPTAIVRVNGIPAQLVNSNFEALVGLSEGANTISISATDLAGNTNTRTFTIYLDTVPPDLTVFTPRDELWTNLSRVLVTGATEQGAGVTINGQNTNVISTVFSGYVTLLEGPNRVEVVSKDIAGNVRTEVRTVFLDRRLPDLVVTAPSDRLTSSSRVIPVLGSVDWGAEVRVNGEPVQVTDFVFSTTISFPEDGTHVIEITARDQAGNTAIITRTVAVDTTVPAIMMSYPQEGMKVKQRMITVSGQTEPFATVVVNTETMLVVGRDGLFSVPVLLEDGENRITIQTTDAAGNSRTEAINVIKPKAAEVVRQDLSWALNLTGLLLGIGIALPIVTFALTDSWRRRRVGVLAELEAAGEKRRAQEAEAARAASMPKVERVGKKRPKGPEPPSEGAKPRPPVMAEPPKPEAAPPEQAKLGLKDKSGATEVSPDEIDQASKMESRSAPAEAKKPETPAGEAGLKDKGEEAEGEAGDTEISRNKK